MNNSALMANLRAGAGLIAALDQSGGSTAATLQAYGVPQEDWVDNAAMFALIHPKRVPIMAAPNFNGRKVLAAILFEQTKDGQAQGQPVPQFLRSRGVASFLKVDQGLEPKTDGVQLMKPIGNLDALTKRATSLGVLGTKMRSVVRRMDRTEIAAIVEQQFKLAGQIAESGLLPILEPEILMEVADRGAAERFIVSEITKRLDALQGRLQVMLKLTIPDEPDIYATLIAHHRVLRVLALSGGLSRSEACNRLARNHGLIASFSRALLEGLDHAFDDTTFDCMMGVAVDQIYSASTHKRCD
jgi:fructose-bisphosphate aldolase, class I